MRGRIIFAIIGSIRNNRPALAKSVMENITGRDLKKNREAVINFLVAGACGNRTHPATFWAATPDLKSGRDTRTLCAPMH